MEKNMALSKDKLIADPAIAYDGDSVIVHLFDGTGNALSSTGGALHVSATNLDIRDLTHVSDSVKIGDGTDFLAINADGSINVNGTDVYDEDSAHSSGAKGSLSLVVRKDTPGSLVDADGDYAPLQVDDQGRLRVTGSIVLDGQYAEDSVHTSGNIGIYNLAVRSDIPAIGSSASGDYASQTVDAYNRLWVNDAPNISMTAAAATVTTTSALLIASLAGRKKLMIQNLGTKEIFIGPSGVTTSSGVRIAGGAGYEIEAGPDLVWHAVASVGTQDVRVLQLA
jgi:hypothetical protein